MTKILHTFCLRFWCFWASLLLHFQRLSALPKLEHSSDDVMKLKTELFEKKNTSQLFEIPVDKKVIINALRCIFVEQISSLLQILWIKYRNFYKHSVNELGSVDFFIIVSVDRNCQECYLLVYQKTCQYTTKLPE